MSVDPTRVTCTACNRPSTLCAELDRFVHNDGSSNRDCWIAAAAGRPLRAGGMDLYRFFDANDRLLYIGISLSAAQRASQHRADKSWWGAVARMDVEHLDCLRDEAAQIEREAIVAERPIHNVVHNKVSQPPPAPERLEWTCPICELPIDDGDGYIEMPSSQIRRYESEMAEWERRDTAAEDPYGLGLVNLQALWDMPRPANWWAVHHACDPDPDDNGYWFDVKRARTYRQLLDWTAHLMGKNWLGNTNWDELIQVRSGGCA